MRMAYSTKIGLVFVVGLFGVYVQAKNFVSNGDFEANMDSWHWGIVNEAPAKGQIDTAVRHSGGMSFRMSINSPLQPEVYGGFSQKITGLTPIRLIASVCGAKGRKLGAAGSAVDRVGVSARRFPPALMIGNMSGSIMRPVRMSPRLTCGSMSMGIPDRCG